MSTSFRRLGALACTLVLSIVAASWGSENRLADPEHDNPAIGHKGDALILPVASSLDSFSLSISVPGVDIRSVVRDQRTYASISLGGSVGLQRDGEPDLPVIRQLVAIPQCRNVRVSVSILDFVDFKTATPVLPSKNENMDLARGSSNKFSQATSVYGANRDYPGKVAEITTKGKLRGQHLALLKLYPVQYNPVSGRIRIIRSFKVTLHFEGAVGAVAKNVGPMQALVSQLVMNYEFQAGRPMMRITNSGPGQVCWCTGNDWEEVTSSASACGADYLIIAGDSLVSSTARRNLVESLASFRANYNGFNVAIASISQLDASPDTFNTPVQIRNLIKAIYDDSSAAHMGDGKLGYVLLLGDAFDPKRNKIVPSSYYFVGLHSSLNAASDAYYSLLSTSDPDDDPFSDVLLGRLPVDSDADNWELSNVLNNILNYEPLSTSAAWTHKLLMVSGGDYGGFSFQEDEYQGFVDYFDAIDDAYIPSDKYVSKMHVGFSALSDSGFSRSVVDTLRNNFWACGLFDHGNYFYLAGRNEGGCVRPIDYDLLDVAAMPFVFAIGSHLGEFDYTADKQIPPAGGGTGACCTSIVGRACAPDQAVQAIDSCDVMCERLVVQPDGAIGAFGYSRSTSTTSAQDDFKNLFRTLFQQNATTLGEVLLGARLMQPEDEQTRFNFTLFGDPAVNIRWTDVSHDTVDVAVRQSDIRAVNGMRYVTTRSDNSIRVKIRNEGKNPASAFSLQLWMGHPDSVSSVLLATEYAPAVPGFGAALDTISFSGTDLEQGTVDIYVLLDPDGDLDESAITNNLSFATFEAHAYEEGYPIRLSESAHHSFVLSDVRDEPGLEIFFSTWKSARCYSGDGEQLWKFVRGTGLSLKTEPLVANRFKDGTPHVIYEAAGYSYTLDAGTGAVRDSLLVDPSLVTAYQYGGQSYAVHDLVGADSALERLLFLGNNLRAVGSNGSTLWERRVASYNIDLDEACIAVADIDANGIQDVVGVRQDTLKVFNGLTGGLRWSKGYGSGEGARTVTLLDVDGDGLMEIAATSRESNDVDWLRVYDTSGNQHWQYSLGSGDAADKRGYVCAGDVDRDGTPEIVAISSAGLVILDTAGQVVASEALEEQFAVGPPLLADIDGQAGLEIVTMTGTENDNTYFPDISPKYVFHIRVYNGQLDQIATPLVVHGDTSLRRYIGFPAIGDTDGDGVSEIVFASPDSTLHVVQIGTQAGVAPWPQRQGNAMCTNVVAQPVIGTYNQPVSLFNTIDVIDDVAFNEATYVDGTATIRVADEDPTPPGSPTADDITAYTDIIVRDEIRSIGSEHQRVRFMSWDGSAESNAPWWSLFVTDSTLNASGEFVHTEIRGALSGITARRPITVQDCLIEDCTERGLNVADAGTVVVAGSTIRGADYGINALDGTTVLLSNSIIVDCGDYGVAVYDDSRLQATGTTFDGNGIATYLGKESGSWVKGTIRGSTYTGNAHGVWISDTGDSTVLVDNCTLENQSTTGMYLEAAKVVVDSTTMRGAEFGIRVTLETALSLSKSAVEDASLYGILADADDTTLDVTKTSFDGNETGLALAAGASWVRGTIRDCTFTNNGDGIWIYDVGDSSVVVDDCVIDDNTTNGIYVENDGDVSITRNTITNNTIGVYSYGSSPAIRSRNVIQYNNAGIKSDDYSTAVVESCTVNNNTNGVVVTNGSNPDLGHETGGSSLGQNIMRPNTTYHVANFTSNDIFAQIDYIPRNPPTQCEPQSTKFYGSVNYEPHLGCLPPDLSAPSSMLMGAGEETTEPRIPARFNLRQNYPNPFNPVTTVAYEVPRPGSQVEIALYDVGGRLVAVLVDEHRTPGFYSVTWNGVNRNGEPVASGVYFLRMRAGHFADTKKLLLLK